jgi:dienelactone hydrolase
MPLPHSRNYLTRLSLLACLFAQVLSFNVQAADVTLPATPDASATTSAVRAPLPPVPLVPGAQVITLWPAGSPMLNPNAPGFDQPEKLNRGRDGTINSVENTHNPSIEVHLAPPDKNGRITVIIAAGGGNSTDNVGGEGVAIAKWLNTLGINAIILRYRIKPYNSATDALYDSLQAVRLVRSQAKDWNIDPDKIGFMGFSAGGEQVARVALNYDKGDPNAPDPVARQSSRPDFLVLVYAGWVKLDTSKVPDDVPPVFMTVAADDQFHATETMDFYRALYNKNPRNAPKLPLFMPELHIYAHGGHANAISPRNGIPFGTWQDRFLDWLADIYKQDAAAAAKAAARSGAN